MDARLKVLVADDDAIARRFFVQALGGFEAHVVEARDGPEALARIRDERLDLVIVDLRMPGFGAEGLVDALAAGDERPALVAVSGELDATVRARLVARGFMDALQKPLTLADVGALVARLRPADALDNAAGLRALGSREALIALRALLARELPGQLAALSIARAAGDGAAIGGVLHMLRASCGFCGLPALGAATQALAADWRADAAWAVFEDASSDALRAL